MWSTQITASANKLGQSIFCKGNYREEGVSHGCQHGKGEGTAGLGYIWKEGSEFSR